MFKNHLKVAWRNLKNNRIFSVINVLGLSLGLAITILLFLFVSYEYSYDSMYKNRAEIHRVLVQTDESWENEIFCTGPAAVAPALKEEVPEVKYAARMLKHDFGEPAFINVNDVNLIEKELYYCDPELFTIFGIDIVKGQPASALERPNTTVVSQSTAAKYFGDQDPIGKIIIVDNRKKLEIVGVYKDFPANSTLYCNVIASFSSTNFAKNATWGNSSFETYVQLEKNTSIASMEKQMQKLLDKNVDKEGQWFTLGLQPLEKVHLYSSDYTNAYTTRIGNIKEIKNLSFLALLILIIACINYMNLITARSQKRAKDVGINKTLGASLKNMIIRFYAETGLITFIALLIGLVMAVTAVPIFNAVTSQEMDISLLINFKFLLGLIAFWVLTTLVACLGLFDLAAYTAEQRKKEIGVRKVLGATVMGITQMLSKDFLKLVFVSLLIAFPIAFIVMQNWLEEFAYRINVNWSVFVIAAMSAFVIAIITVSFQAVKAAMTNPVNSLRTE